MASLSSRFALQCIALGLLAISAAQAAEPLAGLAPKELRGLWYPKSETSVAKCANFLSRDPVEPGSGALVVSERQFVQWGENGPTAVTFLTDVRPRRSSTWRVQGLLDLPPYEAPKVLETYVIEVRKDEMLWSARHTDDQLAEQVTTSVFVRCGY